MVDFRWFDGPTTSGFGRRHYIMSLSKNGRAVLELPVKLSEIIEKGQYLKIDIKCKDTAGRNFKSKIAINFGEYKDTNTTVAYQYNVFLSLTLAVKDIVTKLGDLVKNKDANNGKQH